MNHDRSLHATHHSLYRAWAPTDVPDTDEPMPPRVRVRGPWLAAAPMLLALALVVVGALIVGATAKATANLSRAPKESTVAGAEQMRRQALAVQAFRAREYPVAYGRFAALADDGDAASALMALAMVHHGPVLFGSEWSLTLQQLQRWSALALHDVRERGTALAEHDRGE
ncbi:MAG TPA: hypothetical protein VFO28_20605 [Burkholderiaceae bacterium]|nr:hypothetical protein [Burkholderiaceae bacterium]